MTAAETRPPGLRSVVGAGSANVLARGLAILAGLVTVPLVAGSLDGDQFGLYLTLTTVFAMLSTLDFGIGGAVLSQVSAATAHADRKLVAGVVSSAAFALSVAGAGVLLLTAVTVPFLPLQGLLGAQDVSDATIVLALTVTLAATACAIPLSVAGRVLFGLHRGKAASVFAVIGSAVQTVLLGLCALVDAPLGAFVLAGTSAVLVAGVTTSAYLLWTWDVASRPRWAMVSRERVRMLGREGGMLFLLALLGVVAYQSDTLIIAHYLGADAVPGFALPLRIFGLLPLLAGLFLTPLWAAFRDARERDRWPWIRRTLNRSLVGTLAVSVLCALVLVPLTPWLLHLWVGDEVAAPSLDLRLALGAYVVVMTSSATLAAYLNAMSQLRLQAWLGAVMAVSNIALSVALVTSIGVAGPVWATVITQTVIVLLPCLGFALLHVRRAGREVVPATSP
jgi:O-antigen/teichoic acid export membrane protein